MKDIFLNFKSTFDEKDGCIQRFQIALQLRKGTKPIFIKKRNIPFAQVGRFVKELESLVANGIISPVAATDWGSPIVVIPKHDRRVRPCVDYKCGVNKINSSQSHNLKNWRCFQQLSKFKILPQA